jgi:uncharacterized protein YndB with AHSA1/START domain
MKQQATLITIETVVNAPVEKVWKTWTNPDDIIKWNSPSPEWHTPRAEHDLRPGGKFIFRMEAKDGSYGFDFDGIYDAVDTDKYIEYTLSDGRKVKVSFENKDNGTHIIQTFEAEDQNSIETQRGGWQAILENFRNYAELT